MNLTDWIGFIGVSILLIAFFCNLTNKLKKDNVLYLVLNGIGAGIACLAPIMLHYWPFIILEACWTFVSIFSLINKLLKVK